MDSLSEVVVIPSDDGSEDEPLETSVDSVESTYSSSTTVATGTEVSSSGASSVIDALRAPKLSEVARKRTVRTNPPKGKRRSCLRSACDPKSVTPAQRIREHPGEEFTVSNRRLFCRACREELSLKSTVVNNHIKSAKHNAGKEKLKAKEARERDITSALQVHNEKTHQEGESLPVAQQVYRVKVVTAFLQAGIPMNKVTCFRQLLEENAHRLTDRSHMANLIPFIVEQEKLQLKRDLGDKNVSVIFDGTTRLGEALVIVVRFVDDKWDLQQRLIQVKMLAKSMTGEEIARELIDTLSVNYGVSSNRLLAAMRDRASVNNVALRTLKIVYPNLVDVGCFAHTINLAGERFKIPTLLSFINGWNSLFVHSAKARLCWKEQCGVSMPSYCPTRWWSKWEVMKAVLVMFADVQLFLSTHEDIAPATRSKLLAILSDPAKRILLQVELAAVVDAGEPLVKATYKLEGDGPLALQCYELVSTALASIQTAHFPNVAAIARQLSGGGSDCDEEQLVAYALECVKPGLQYISDIFSTTLKDALATFKAARLFNPHKVQEMRPSAGSVDSLAVIPFIKPESLSNLKVELPSYLAKAADTSPEVCPLSWWQANASELPHWSAAARQVVLIQPTSAASERIFSILNNCFNDRQDSSLQDYIECSLMLQYNHH